jgi:hypothetical protein
MNRNLKSTMIKNMVMLMVIMQHMILITNTITAQENRQPEVIPGTDASTMASQHLFSVNKYTGNLNFSLPLTEIESNGRNLSLSLNYNGGGVHPDIHPGMMGLNWNLDFGGVITRSINGSADEEGFGEGEYYFGGRVPYIFAALNYQNWLNEDSTDTYEKLRDFAIARVFGVFGRFIDSEPDFFNFSFFGKSGKFYLDHTGTWKVISEHNLKIELDVSDSDILMDPFIDEIPGLFGTKLYEKVIKGFVIVDEDGYRYTFGYDEDALEYSLPFFKQPSTPAFGTPNWTVTAWYITKVEDFHGNELYNFEYERKYFTAQLYENRSSVTAECRLANEEWHHASSTNRPYGDGSLNSLVYPVRITSNRNEVIEFRTSIA